jgi:hypothetical protein
MTATYNNSYSNESKITSLTMHPSSVIYVPLTFQSIEEFVTSLVQASPASHIPMQENERDQKIVETSGPIPSDALARWDQATQSWKTSQASFLMDTPALLPGNFPKSGTARNGILYPLPMPVRPISERDGGALLGRWMTPNTMDRLSHKSQKALDHEYTHRPNRSSPGNLRDQIAVAEGKSTWPTPKSQDSKHGPLTEWEKNTNHPGTKDSLRYKVMINWPTPTEDDSSNVNPKPNRRPGLISKVNEIERWPTPTAAEGGKIGNRANYGQIALSNHPAIVGLPDRDKMEKSENDGKTSGVAFRLNPAWVSWLMGIPTGWESLEPMDRNAYDEWFEDMTNRIWWTTERDLPRVTKENNNRIKRLKSLGNGIVPASLALFLNQATLLPYLENPQG